MRKFLVIGAFALTAAATAMTSCAADNQLLGSNEPVSAATRVVVIGPNTTYINVDRGDIVKFVAGDKSFAWSFTAPSTISEVDLNDIAPAGMLDHVVKAYIKRIPIYDGG